MSTFNYNPRALAALRADGYTATSVDHYNAYSQRHEDLFGLFDILAVGHGHTRAIQVTSRSNMAARRNKIDIATETREIACVWNIEVWGYDQPNGARTRYRCKVQRYRAGSGWHDVSDG